MAKVNSGGGSSNVRVTKSKGGKKVTKVGIRNPRAGKPDF